MQRNHLHLLNFYSSTYYFYFITPFHLRSIVCPLQGIFCVSSVSFAIVSLWDCAFYCIRCDVISAKTLSEFTYTSSEWHSSEEKVKKNGKDSNCCIRHIFERYHELWWALFLVHVFFLALNRPYYHHPTKIVCTLFAACFSFRLHYIYSVGFLCIFLCLSV